MKKVLALFLASIFCLSLCACNNSEKPVTTTKSNGEITTIDATVDKIYTTNIYITDKDAEQTQLNSIKSILKDKSTVLATVDQTKIYKWEVLIKKTNADYNFALSLKSMSENDAKEASSKYSYSEKDALNSAIRNETVLQQAKKVGISLTSEQTKLIKKQAADELDSIKKQDENYFAKYLEAYGMTQSEYLENQQIPAAKKQAIFSLYKAKVCPLAKYKDAAEQSAAFEKHVDELMKKYDVKYN